VPSTIQVFYNVLNVLEAQYIPEKMQEITNEIMKYKIDITALQEI
jgi:hypothetical protein